MNETDIRKDEYGKVLNRLAMLVNANAEAQTAELPGLQFAQQKLTENYQAKYETKTDRAVQMPQVPIESNDGRANR